MRTSRGLWFVFVFLVPVLGSAQVSPPPPGFSPGTANGLSEGDSSRSGDVSHDFGISPQGSDAESDANSYGVRGWRRGSSSDSSNRWGSLFELPPGPAAPPAFPNVWFSAEALLWWTKANPVPVPLVVEGQTLGTGPVALGGQSLSMPLNTGGKFTLGFAFGAEHDWALEGSYFFLNNASASQGVSSNGSTGSAPLSFPFFDPTLAGESSSPIALPGSYAGIASITAQTLLQGLDVNILHNLSGGGDGFRFDVLGGFRYVNLQEDLTFNTSSPNVAPNPPDFFRTFDDFNTQNNFYGGQVGGRAGFDNGRFFANATGKLALGATVESVNTNGGTFTNYQGSFASAQGAYLTQPTNIGSQSGNRFAVLPELNMNVGLYLGQWVRLTVGYSFLYLSSVARPGDQIDRVINPSQSYAISGNNPANLSGAARPAASIQSSDFWAQGLNLGMEVRY